MEKERIIKDKNKSSVSNNINNNISNKEEIMKEITILKTELQTKNDLLNNLIPEINKRNLIIKDYETLEKEKNLINDKLHQLNADLENIKNLNTKLKLELELITSEKEEYKKTIEQLTNKINQNSQKEIKYESIENTNNDLIKKMISLQDILSSKENEIISLKKLNNELTQSNGVLTTQINDYKIIFNTQENNHLEINQKIDTYKSKIKELLNINNTLNNENALLRNKNCDLIQDNKRMKDILKGIKSENENLNKEINEQAINISKNETKKDELEIKNKENEIKIEKYLQKISSQSKEQLTMEENIKNLNNKLSKYESDIFDMKSTLIFYFIYYYLKYIYFVL